MKACVLAQVWAVRGDAPVDGPVAFVNASDGVGVGIAIDGQLLRGTHNMPASSVTLPSAWTGPGVPADRGLLGGLRFGPGHGRPVPRHRPLLARIGRAQ